VQIPQSAPIGQPERGIELHERLEDERALGQARVRDFEAGLADGLVAVEQEIEVDRAWAPPLLAGTVAAEAPFDLEQALEELPRPKAGLELGSRVHEPRLVGVSNGISLAEGRNRHDGDLVELAQTRESLAESRLALAEDGAEAPVGTHEKSP